MFKSVGTIFVTSICLFTLVCTPPERRAYEVVVAAKSFIDSEKAQHPECNSASTSNICVDLVKATNAKDALIDAAEVYCSGTSFETGGPCQPPVKGTPAYDQAVAKLNAAIAIYNQAEANVKGAL